MELKRIDSYTDSRFSQKVLLQHGCFLADGAPCEVEIVSDFEAIVRGGNAAVYPEIIEEFRFYTPHITKFCDETGNVIREYPRADLLTVSLDRIQPSQFFVDEDKIAAVSTFIHAPEDIIIQALPFEDGYISLDGHTRLYYAVMKGWTHVRVVVDASDEWVYGFVEEARKRNIFSAKDMQLVSHGEYEEKWNRFCDEFFASKDEN